MFAWIWTLCLTSARADLVRLMKTGDVAIAQIHQDLSDARETIDFSTYIWDPCSSVAKLVTADLAARARAGVKVRVLLDAWVQTPTERAALSRHLSELGLIVRYFNPRAGYDPMINRRMHAKIIVVDHRKYYLGGRNVADDYFDLGTNNWIDRDVAVEGESAAEAEADFERLWSSELTRVENRISDDAYATWSKACDGRDTPDLGAWLDRHGADVLTEQPTHACARVHAVTDDPGFADSPGRVYVPLMPLRPDQYARKFATRAVVDFVDAAESLTVENYTYVPEGRLKDGLDSARERGVPIDLFTNAVMDQAPLHYLKERAVRADQRGSERIFELSAFGSTALPWALTPPRAHWSIHTKAMASGPKWGPRRDGLVGSFNFDPRSYGTNVEAAVVVTDCPEFAAELEDSMNRLRAFFERDRDCAICHEKPVVSLSDALKGQLGRRLWSTKRPGAGRPARGATPTAPRTSAP